MSLELAFTSAAGFEGMSRRRTSDFLMYGLPFMGFMIAGWYGIASVVQGKRDLKVTLWQAFCPGARHPVHSNLTDAQQPGLSTCHAGCQSGPGCSGGDGSCGAHEEALWHWP